MRVFLKKFSVVVVLVPISLVDEALVIVPPDSAKKYRG
jgi:hypothetical protein